MHLCIYPLRNRSYAGRGALLDTLLEQCYSREQESEAKDWKRKEAANTVLASMFYSTLKYTSEGF